MRRRTAERLLHLAGTVLLIACLTRAQQSSEGNAAIRFAAAAKDRFLSVVVLFRRRSDICAPEFEKLLHCVCQQGRSFLGDACQLSEEIVQKTLDVAAREWHVDDAFFAHHDHDLQNVVDCASDGDAILLNTSITVQPRKQVEISKRLEIRAFGETDTLTKAAVTCPSNDSLFLIRSVMERRYGSSCKYFFSSDVDVVLENISIQNCVFTDPFYHLSVIEVSCNRTREDDIVLEMHNVEFSHNSNPGGIAGFRVQEPSCVEVRMRNFRFIENQYHLCSVFGHQNDLDNIVIGENVHRHQPSVVKKTTFDEGVSQRIPHTNDPDDDVLQYAPL